MTLILTNTRRSTSKSSYQAFPKCATTKSLSEGARLTWILGREHGVQGQHGLLGNTGESMAYKGSTAYLILGREHGVQGQHGLLGSSGESMAYRGSTAYLILGREHGVQGQHGNWAFHRLLRFLHSLAAAFAARVAHITVVEVIRSGRCR
jgi:hypothetical protein